jgi:endonuclease-3
VLLFALGKPALPVDTHVHRVAKRLGLIGPKVGADQAHALLEHLDERKITRRNGDVRVLY